MLRTQAQVFFAPPQETELIDWWIERIGVFKLNPLGIRRYSEQNDRRPGPQRFDMIDAWAHFC